jgi:hypothetical protein
MTWLTSTLVKSWLRNWKMTMDQIFLFASNIENIMQEFSSRFADFEDMRDSIVLFNNPLGVNIED